MTVILILLTFAIFIAIDYMQDRRKVSLPATEQAPIAPRPAVVHNFVEGFLVPNNLRYHTGHGWALRERRGLMRVGADEFAAALLGPIDRIELPKPGHWVRQGQKAWTFYRDGEKAEMTSPVEGEIIELNPEVLKNPSLLRKDPFGQGWLATVWVPDEENVQRNFLPMNLVKTWMQEAAHRLFARQPQLAGPVMADGGRPIDNLTAGLPHASWKELTREFFLGE